jgi:hypothetical protein
MPRKAPLQYEQRMRESSKANRGTILHSGGCDGWTWLSSNTSGPPVDHAALHHKRHLL